MEANAFDALVSAAAGAGSDRGAGGAPRASLARPLHGTGVCGSVAAVQCQPNARTGRAPPTCQDRPEIRRVIASVGAVVLTVASTLFTPAVPDGFKYRDAFISHAEERSLLDAIEPLPFAQVVMRGVVARRRTAHFGWTYGYFSRRTEPGPPLPPFLVPVRARFAEWAGINAELFVEALVTEYPPGATIGWHRDAPMFGDVVAGLSLGASCRMKFRRYVSPSAVRDAEGPRRTTHQIVLAPRSGYVMAGAARRQFEHSIPAVTSPRYSITFRTLRSR